VPISVEEGTLF